jgi:hypothetical protein
MAPGVPRGIKRASSAYEGLRMMRRHSIGYALRAANRSTRESVVIAQFAAFDPFRHRAFVRLFPVRGKASLMCAGACAGTPVKGRGGTPASFG